MAMMATPTQEHFRPWSYDKMGNYNYESPHSESPSSVFYDAEERVRISNTMEQLKVALKEHAQPGFDDEYQSSEEALSPMLQDEATAVEEDEEDVTIDDESIDDDSEEQLAIWSEQDAKAFKVDIAIAICITTAGKAHVVNVPQRWSAFRGRQNQRYASHSDSRSPSAPTKSTTRAPPRPDTNIRESHSSSSSRLDTPKGSYPRSTPITSSHRAASSTASAGSFSQSTSGISIHSFLNSGPYELPQSKPTTRSRLRSVSSKLIASLNSPSVEAPTSDDHSIKQKRRRSLIAATRPESAARPDTANAPFFFSHRSRDEWYREHSQQPLQPRSATPTQRKFPKMVARGATERAPMLELPPCPKDYDQEFPALSSYNSMPLDDARKSSSTNLRKRKSLLGLRG